MSEEKAFGGTGEPAAPNNEGWKSEAPGIDVPKAAESKPVVVESAAVAKGAGEVEGDSVDAVKPSVTPAAPEAVAEVVEPEAVKVDPPKADVPAAVTPEVVTPEVVTPEVVTPEVVTPEVQAPVVEAPAVEAPKAEVPEVVAPKAEAPKVEVPEVEAPKAEVPVVEAPKVEAPKAVAPVAEVSEVVEPEVVKTEVSEPEVVAVVEKPAEVVVPEVEAPVVEAPEAKVAEPEAVAEVVAQDVESRSAVAGWPVAQQAEAEAVVDAPVVEALPETPAEPVVEAEAVAPEPTAVPEPQAAVAPGSASALKGWRVAVDGSGDEVVALAALVAAHGGAVAKRITPTVRFMIAENPDAASAPLRQVRDLGIQILTTAQARERIEQAVNPQAASAAKPVTSGWPTLAAAVELPRGQELLDAWEPARDAASPTAEEAAELGSALRKALTAYGSPVPAAITDLDRLAKAAGQVRDRFFADWLPVLNEHRTAKRDDDALELLLVVVEAAERHAAVAGTAPVPVYTERAAVILRRRKDYAGEVELLERWVRANPEPVPATDKLAQRLESVRKLQSKGR
ncbi:hypothetical protein [Actinosynnema pretiosum]|uniref:Uncharacterized protein n=1 Tax=Actinosynnema pretiosum TaxID=42197 RepID=A0A290Z5T0_9PSEU|nr:hypothetical protein [Actinosynnema pretiosum]ATE54380.1 hypothetical protein CNX65_14660 [Actinosynnema pretiosum]